MVLFHNHWNAWSEKLQKVGVTSEKFNENVEGCYVFQLLQTS